jgi:hypothetical protein
MKALRYTVLPIFVAMIWVSLNEFVRNQAVLMSQWVSHFEAMGLAFPAEPINGAMWGVWSLLMAIGVYFYARRFTLLEATGITWFVVFVLMWVSSGNMGFLPFGILPVALPWSVVEAAGTVYIIQKLGPVAG